MEQVLNTKERNTAFIKFLSFFLVTVALVVAAVFFDFKVPSKQNEKLMAASRKQNTTNDKEEKFVVRMQEVVRLLDSLDKPETSVGLINSQLDDGIKDLINLQKSDNPLYEKLNTAVVDKFLALKEEKKAGMERSKENKDLRTRLNNCEKDLDVEIQKAKNSSNTPSQFGQ